jgi:transposase
MGAHLADRPGGSRCARSARLVSRFPRRLLRPGEKGGAGVGLTRKGKGTKWMLVVDRHGTPLGCHRASARCAEVRLAEPTLATVRMPRRRGRPKQRPRQLVADRGYDRGPLRQRLQLRGIRVCVPPKRRPARYRPKVGRPVVLDREAYAERFKVERTFAWLGNYRRLLIRWERLLTVYQGFFAFAAMLLCTNRLVQQSP